MLNTILKITALTAVAAIAVIALGLTAGVVASALGCTTSEVLISGVSSTVCSLLIMLNIIVKL